MSLKGLLRERVIKPLREAQGTPSSIARGGALGMWIALTPTVGAQMLICGLLAVPLRANLPVALAMVWISNPITLVPLYFLFYLLGAVMLGMESAGYSTFSNLLSEHLKALPEVGLVETMLRLGHEVLWPMVVGSVVIATLAAIPTYYLLLSMAERRRARLTGDVVEAGERPTESPSSSQDPAS